MLYALLISSTHATCPVHHIVLDFITVIFSETYRLWSSSLCSLLQPPAASSLLFPNILITMFSDTLSLCSSVSVKTKFHTHIKQQVKLWFCIF
jgi:hypothetical protein